jgi:hypothetical protein
MLFYVTHKVALNNMVEQLALLLCIWEAVCVSCLTFNLETSYSDRFLIVFLNHSTQIRGQYYKIDHNHFLPQYSKFLIHKSPHITSMAEKASLINEVSVNHKIITQRKLKMVQRYKWEDYRTSNERFRAELWSLLSILYTSSRRLLLIIIIISITIKNLLLKYIFCQH